MRIVFLTSLVPDGNPSTGYEIANAAIIGALRRSGADVTIMGFIRPGRSPADPERTILLGELDPATANVNIFQKLIWLAKSLISGLPFSAAKLRTLSDGKMRNMLAKIPAADAYIVNGIQIAAAYGHLLAGNSCLYVAHNVEFASAAQNSESASAWLMRLLYAREARLLEAVERRISHDAEFVFTLTESDRQILRSAGSSAVVPLVTQESSPVYPAPRKTEIDAAMIGTWTWQPNLTGLIWFLDEVLPLLPDNFRVQIAGAVPAGFAVRYKRAEFVGKVEDARSFIRKARVVPLVSRAGTGVQIKTIETFELGLPAVATSDAVRGLTFLPANCVLADEPKAFAKAMLKTVRAGAPDVDGTRFFRSQRSGLDKAIQLGISAAVMKPRKAAA